MRSTDLLTRSLRHYWRTNLAVVFGVATAVTVLGGALLVGNSVRGSLRDLVLDRIGNTDLVVASPEFFTDRLASIGSDPEFGNDFGGLVPLVALPGMATNQEGGRRAGRLTVYGVPPEFWTFHGRRPDDSTFTDQRPRGAAERSRWPARLARRRAAPCCCASNGLPTSRSNRCTAARTMSGAPCG